jgi:peptidyl-prolyl cis-trans isomerase A (cyclophilin A)
MSKKTVGIIVVVLLLAGAGAYTMFFSEPRLTAAQLKKAQEAQRQMDQIKQDTVQQHPGAAGDPPAPVPATPAPVPAEVKDGAWPEKAPDLFKVKFACSNGDFVVECHKDWAPIGVERFYELVKNNFYNEARFFRVLPGFVAQFGIPADPAVAAKWRDNTIKDEPVKQSNVDGTITFAKSGAPNSRTTQLFLNTANNTRLDSMGFSAFGKVVEGLDVVKKINSEYGENPDQGLVQAMGNEYLKKTFPRLDYIKSISLVK